MESEKENIGEAIVEQVRLCWDEHRWFAIPILIVFTFLAIFVNAIQLGHELKYSLRKRIGDPVTRNDCCGKYEPIYRDISVKDIPELYEKLQLRGKPGYNTYYDCEICGQPWSEFLETYGKGLMGNVCKLYK